MTGMVRISAFEVVETGARREKDPTMTVTKLEVRTDSDDIDIDG